MWEIDLDPTDFNSDPAVNSEWTLVTAKNHIDKLKKQDKGKTVRAGQFIKTHIFTLCYLKHLPIRNILSL
jgi:hypothetical protein